MAAAAISPVQKFALVVAGGTGTRMGAGMPKQMLPLKERAVLAHTLDRFLSFDPEIQIVSVLHPSLADSWSAFLDWHFGAVESPRLHICLGGAERSESVQNGLHQIRDMVGEGRALVAIHDGVRPFVNHRILSEGFALAEEKGNAVAVVPVKSSMRMKTENGSKAVERDLFYHVQTPQIFFLDEILTCYNERGNAIFTDDASLAESQGMTIQMYLGSYDNLKITTPEDLLLAERLLERGDW
ncbi:MAG: 2-C-methyl-D-erythritol 4-phosphate cytidylyltransferase [Bacteroidetes bacterium]|jgi:2-C-methyl-D-erythritol 4-phosphate cytidylyltransferase|nr:2-C-methyl-D-erythritol 4-phosphate cytidylyltransferase [Bacteroidota bacterium]MBL0015402.1 2-C-methyl-D-erythritol 4-phosphate cytidylyltransferase [Bacteroidota bacterium]MBP6639768.1 2-C-methyl-D-erythritol 4-phosphate cytidylyltransferase [Bacteroidia bacterium]MBP6722385.1 2-C-methyl-D-erythritol 4-phosphate cytidylyltransferase [Bacteroidia bacterium]MBP8073715.1 2-C-methyl-D-erythritol 4-phosphate cytidylyltransferase [Bacteroidia bacterium]